MDLSHQAFPPTTLDEASSARTFAAVATCSYCRRRWPNGTSLLGFAALLILLFGSLFDFFPGFNRDIPGVLQ